MDKYSPVCQIVSERKDSAGNVEHVTWHRDPYTSALRYCGYLRLIGRNYTLMLDVDSITYRVQCAGLVSHVFCKSLINEMPQS